VFAFLRGTVALKGANKIALDVHGAGYALSVPESTARRIAVGQDVTLLTYCHIREDTFQIFGFLRDEEKALFEQLLTINGVGPRVALAVLSGMSVAELGRAVLDADIKPFTKVSGVGKKMAQRIVLELKNKMGQDTELSAILGEPDKQAEPMDGDDVYEALLSLGCTPPEAQRAAKQARASLGPDASDEDIVRAALRSMAKV